MTQQIDVKEPLTKEELERVTDFANELISNRPAEGERQNRTSDTPRKISFEGWAGCLAHVDPEKSNKQLLREAWDALIDESEHAGERPRE